MVNRLRKGLWFMLIVSLVYLSSPGYPDSKKTIHNLPVNQDMGVFSKRYSEGEKILEVMKQSDCEDCWSTLNDAAKCKRCVRLRENCGDCCLTEDKEGKKTVKCGVKDDKEYNYNCGAVPFEDDACDPIVCDTDRCNTKCRDYKYDADSPCNGVEEGKGTEGEVDDSAKPLRWQRKGCPEEDSEDLAPEGADCELVQDTAGLNRKWKCLSDGLKPKFAEQYYTLTDGSSCLPDSDADLDGIAKPDASWGYGDYYAVTKVSTVCEKQTDQCEGFCGGSCEAAGKNKSCSPNSCDPDDCTPACPEHCEYSCVLGTACVSEDLSTKDCICSGSQCPTARCTPNCNPECGSEGCSSTCSSPCLPNVPYYVYVLSKKYQDYIEKCIAYADNYDACMDRVNCCKKGVCRDEVVKRNDGTYGCNPGSSENCDTADCGKRICYADDCADFGAAASCAQTSSDANGCLIYHPDCFKEMDSAFFYPYVARSGDALNIIWQVVTKEPAKVVDGLNFYTLVKVWKLDADGNPEKAVHTSMMNVKSLEASFSIYGTTNVPKVDLEGGASYQARLYYFLPPREFCMPKCECLAGDADCEAEACEDTNNIELTYLSLILQRIRE